jgi:hypothetical protein
MPEPIKVQTEEVPKCPRGFRWCSKKQKCIPEGEKDRLKMERGRYFFKEDKQMDNKISKELNQEISSSTILGAGIVGLGAAAIANRVAYCKEKYKDDASKAKKCVFWYVKKEKEKAKKKDKVKEAHELVDTVFDEPAEFKKAGVNREADEMVDVILDNCGKDHSVEEVENQLQNAPTDDPGEEEDRLKADIGGEDEVTPGGEDESEIEGAVNVFDNMLKLNEATAYQKFFQAKLKSMGVNSPAALPTDKKKAFFNAVDKEWKAKKESD